MKTLFTLCAFFAFAINASAQATRDDNNDNQDKIQQEPTRDVQRQVESAARQPEVKSQNEKARRDSEDIRKKETERSTGKEDKNPAVDKPKPTLQPAKTQN